MTIISQKQEAVNIIDVATYQRNLMLVAKKHTAQNSKKMTWLNIDIIAAGEKIEQNITKLNLLMQEEEDQEQKNND